MTLEQLIRVIHLQQVQTRMIKPERFVVYDTFEKCCPELYPQEMSPVRMQAASVQTRKAVADILKGKKIDDRTMTDLFGVDNATLDRALEESNPIKNPLPQKLVLLTFDDSTLDHYTDACPIIEEYGGKANLFITEMRNNRFPGATNFDDKTTHMTWEQIAELSDRGHQICNHSWHHDCSFVTAPREQLIEEIQGLEQRCSQYGIPNPSVFGYPMGPGSAETAALLHEMGYHWGRGDQVGASPARMGPTSYDPLIDSPFFIPQQMVSTEDDIRAVLDSTVNGNIILLVYHDVNNDLFVKMPFADQIRAIYEYGGKCITFNELESYVDFEKAYQYTSG